MWKVILPILLRKVGGPSDIPRENGRIFCYIHSPCHCLPAGFNVGKGTRLPICLWKLTSVSFLSLCGNPCQESNGHQRSLQKIFSEMPLESEGKKLALFPPGYICCYYCCFWVSKVNQKNRVESEIIGNSCRQIFKAFSNTSQNNKL